MYIFESTHSRNLYISELQLLADRGELVEVRGRKTLELLNVATVVTEPWHHCILLPSRRWNPWLALSEALWILAGRNDVAVLKPYNSHIGDYSDNGNTLYGAYGARIYGQIDHLIERLQKDSNDRRAVLQIWDNNGKPYKSSNDINEYRFDLTTDSKDPPCNNLIYFKLRNNKLHMTVICRSNDLHFGLFAVNLPTFGILQSYIAARLGVEIGTQTHLSNSLHIYTDDKRAVDITDRMLYKEPEDMPVYPEHSLAFENLQVSKHQEFVERCSAVLEDVYVGSKTAEVFPFLVFARYFLRAYRERDLEIIARAPYRERYQDWILAGNIFAEKMWK